MGKKMRISAGLRAKKNWGKKFNLGKNGGILRGCAGANGFFSIRAGRLRARGVRRRFAGRWRVFFVNFSRCVRARRSSVPPAGNRPRRVPVLPSVPRRRVPIYWHARTRTHTRAGGGTPPVSVLAPPLSNFFHRHLCLPCMFLYALKRILTIGGVKCNNGGMLGY